MTTLLDQLNANNPSCTPRNTTIKHEVGVKEETVQTVLGTVRAMNLARPTNMGYKRSEKLWGEVSCLWD